MVNPAKLKSLVDLQSAGPSAAALGMPPPPPDAGLDDDDDSMPEDEEEPMDPTAKGEKLLADWGEFGTTLKDSATDLHDLAVDVGPGLMLKDVPPDVIKDVGKGVDRMPDELSMGLSKYVSALSPEDMTALAAALCKEIGGKADDGLLLAYLTAAGKYAGEEVDVDDGFNEPEVDEDAAEEDPEDAGDDPASPPAGDAPVG